MELKVYFEPYEFNNAVMCTIWISTPFQQTHLMVWHGCYRSPVIDNYI